MGPCIVVAVDGKESLRALEYAAKHLLHKPSARLHIVTVLPPVNHAMAPSAPIATAGAVTAISQAWQAQLQADQAHAAKLLSHAEEMCTNLNVQLDIVSFHTLPAGGGASGVAESLVQHCRLIEDPILVMCSRGLGSLQKVALSFVGLGSVSDYCIARSSYATVIVKAGAATGPTAGTPTKHKVCVCVDDSENCMAALDFAGSNFQVEENSEIHVVSVAAPSQFPVVMDLCVPHGAQISGPNPTLVMIVLKLEFTAPREGLAWPLTHPAGVQAKQWEEEKEVALKNAESSCAKAIDVLLKQGAPESQLFWKALQPKGGAGGAGQSLVQYCEENAIDTCCVGSHGYGAVMKGLRALVGLGSVSDFCAKRLQCCVCVVRPRGTIIMHGQVPEAQPEAEPEEEQAHAHTA